MRLGDESTEANAEFEGLDEAETRARIAQGVAIWRAAFNGTSPRHFSFPGQWGSRHAVRILRHEYGMYVRTLFDGLVARIYHCDDGWCELTCKSWFVDLF